MKIKVIEEKEKEKLMRMKIIGEMIEEIIGEIRKVNVKGRLVIVDPGVLKLNLTPPSKFMLIMWLRLFCISES